MCFLLCVWLGGCRCGATRATADIQDYVNIYALKIWQEELTRIILFNVERVCGLPSHTHTQRERRR
jgi:hypothetical protein